MVSVLKELNVAPRLSHVIEGESLFNDGTAMVLFTVFKVRQRSHQWPTQRCSSQLFPSQDAMVEHKSVDVGHFTAVLARLSVGGVALGLLIGAITWFVVARITHDKMAELAVTIAAAYSAFSIAEALPQGYNVSGVLSLVTLGLVLASTEAKANLSRIGFVEQFWHTAEYLANTYVPCATDCIVHNSGISYRCCQDHFLLVWSCHRRKHRECFGARLAVPAGAVHRPPPCPRHRCVPVMGCHENLRGGV